MVASQNLAFSQLTEQVSQIKLENKQLLDCFNWLSAQMEAFMSNQQTPTNKHQARGHRSESGHHT